MKMNTSFLMKHETNLCEFLIVESKRAEKTYIYKKTSRENN